MLWATTEPPGRRRKTMARVIGLGHVGIYVRDLERMVGFYRDVMGMQVTKQNWRLGIVFLSADPQAVDHEIALMRGRPSAEDPHLIQQISMRVETLNDLRDFHRRLRAEGYRTEHVGNRTEVFWLTGRPSWVPVANPIDIEQPDETVLAEVDRLWERVRHVPVGGQMSDEPASLEIAR